MRITAMVIDDSRIMRKMVMDSLNKLYIADFEFIEARDGEDALKKFDPKHVDIMFVDWNMPNLNGIDLVNKVKRMKKTDHIAIVMVTSEKVMSKVQIALDEAGVDAYISKPFTIKELDYKLSKIFSQVLKRKGKSAGFFSKLKG